MFYALGYVRLREIKNLDCKLFFRLSCEGRRGLGYVIRKKTNYKCRTTLSLLNHKIVAYKNSEGEGLTGG